MAGQRTCAREHHGPRDVGGPAPEFPVDEVGEPPEEQPDGRADRAHIRKPEERHVDPTRHEIAGEKDTDEPAVE